MFLRRKLTVMATVALLSTSLLAGCSSSGENSNGGSNGNSCIIKHKFTCWM